MNEGTVVSFLGVAGALSLVGLVVAFAVLSPDSFSQALLLGPWLLVSLLVAYVIAYLGGLEDLLGADG